jgi:hypothetical protein
MVSPLLEYRLIISFLRIRFMVIQFLATSCEVPLEPTPKINF